MKKFWLTGLLAVVFSAGMASLAQAGAFGLFYCPKYCNCSCQGGCNYNAFSGGGCCAPCGPSCATHLPIGPGPTKLDPICHSCGKGCFGLGGLGCGGGGGCKGGDCGGGGCIGGGWHGFGHKFFGKHRHGKCESGDCGGYSEPTVMDGASPIVGYNDASTIPFATNDANAWNANWNYGYNQTQPVSYQQYQYNYNYNPYQQYPSNGGYWGYGYYPYQAMPMMNPYTGAYMGW